MAYNDQGNAFSVLMESMWEGGPVYDITLGNTLLRDAEAMCALFFPEAWADRECVGETESSIITFPDDSKASITKDSVQMLSSAPNLPAEIEIGELRPYEIELLIQAKLIGGDTEADPVIKSLRLQYACLMGDDPRSYDITSRA